jgi:hypothetical protein
MVVWLTTLKLVAGTKQSQTWVTPARLCPVFETVALTGAPAGRTLLMPPKPLPVIVTVAPIGPLEGLTR